ncbi:pilus assembly protein CpaF [Dietzia kunjamensis subsp. schimae]|uniref:Pilus assembly protein CpaF n=1 Tax=Dietzia kunjamensis subsp. schimae TaxID=498198 RepID=A0ABY1N1Z3_9ACTN|nr:CpaF family protein [Dietzia kunjamensis]MBB1015845.1 CpaF family protein [Dietzia kunjamensis subsp. schimae]SMO72224.1 pilus assembly protein CpaF [Dietzia kunjamensis subsp. schimae]
MSLSERLRAARVAPGATGTDAPASDAASPIPAAPPSMPTVVAPTGTTTKPATATSTPSTKTAGSTPADDPTADPLVALKERAASALFERIGARLNNPSLTEDQLHAMVRSELNKVVEDETVPLTSDQRVRLITDVQADVLGHGPLEKLLEDPEITEIMVNGPDMIFVERAGQLTRHPSRFASEEHLRQVIERIVSRIGRRVDESSPLVDARLADGSRVNAVIPPLAVNGSSLTIRKFSKDPFKVHDLIRFGTLTPEMSELLQACVEARLNIIVSGGTGSGKTTLLNVLSSYIPEGERIVTIEDAVELQLQQDHVVRLESRPANIEGRGEITIRELVCNSLRMRPDRIVVGEVRGGETLDMLQAMNTGHDGSLSTVHSNSPRDAIARLETLVLMAGMDLPLRAIREQIASAVDVIIQLTRLRDGTRRVTAVTEVQGMEGQTVTLQDAFLFDYSAGLGPDGKFLGKPQATGVRPRFTDRFNELGITLSPRVFGATTENPGSIR